MSAKPDPLEEQLSALRPHEVSPELRRHIARRLAEVPRVPHRRLWWLAFTGGLAASCLAVVLLWHGGGPRVEPKQAVRPEPAPPAPAEDAGPTLRAYERALDRSPEELDALLDQNTGVTPELRPELVRGRALTRSEAALQALLGEH
jgi:hypothetical protein